MKTKLCMMIVTLLSLIICAIPIASNAVNMPRDPNGDGVINISDRVCILQYLKGKLFDVDKRALDFDQNGIISQMDAYKVMIYDSGLTNIVPSAVTGEATIPCNTDSVSYIRHDCTNTTADLSYQLLPNQVLNLTETNLCIDDTDIIIGNNDMTPDNNTAVVKLLLSDGSWGSGFIISNNTIATAAHCVYSSGSFRNFSIKLYDGNNNVVQTRSPHYIHIPQNYIININNSNSKPYDYALIYFDNAIDTNSYGEFNFGVALNDYPDNNGTITISGFPAVSNDPTINGGERYKAVGTLYPTNSSGISSNNWLLKYNADTSVGDSGGPGYVPETVISYNQTHSFNTSIAIHTGWDSQNSINYNRGIRLDEVKLKFYFNNPFKY